MTTRAIVSVVAARHSMLQQGVSRAVWDDNNCHGRATHFGRSAFSSRGLKRQTRDVITYCATGESLDLIFDLNGSARHARHTITIT